MLLAKSLFLIEMPGGGEWILILLGIIILFGGKKIPELARGIGRGIRDFKDAKDGVKREIESGINEADKKGTNTLSKSVDHKEYAEEKK